MKRDRYSFSATRPDLLEFEFESDGPNGKIRKVVKFTLANDSGRSYFNLAFGDWVEGDEKLDYEAISNNKDSEKILATVASTVLKIIDQFPDIPVFAEGSNQARTRLYQIGISKNLGEIESLLEVYGFHKGYWESFRRNVKYDGFLVWQRRK